VKTNADGSQHVFVNSISTGEPVAGAQVTLLGKNGIPLMEQTTAADGHTRLPTTSGFSREQEPTVYVVRNGRDSVFMPFNRYSRKLQYSRFDVGGEYRGQSRDAVQVKAQVFTDRGLYRPGETAQIAAIVKKNDWSSLGPVPMVLTVRNPSGQVAFERRIRMPASGFLEVDFSTEPTAPTGNYNATLQLIVERDRRRVIGSSDFKVEEFLPDRLRIRSTISGQKNLNGQKNQGWQKPNDLFCDVSLNNLFGTPAEARRITGELELQPTSLTFSDYPGYQFNDPLRQPDTAINPVRRRLTGARTDATGQARLPLNLDQYDKGIYRLTVYTNGFEADGGRSVASKASVMLSPLDYLIGHKATTDLSYLDKDSTHTVSFVGLNSAANPLPLNDLTLTLVEEKFVSALVKRPNGTFAYQSVKKEQTLTTEPWAISATGSDYSLPTARSGSFALKISDASGLIHSKVAFTVAGARNLTGNLERNAELDLKLRGKNFVPGEMLELEITAPYTGTGLITIERDGVYSYQWFNSSTTTSVQSIQVPENLEGNAYVNVAFIRDLDSPEIFVSPLSYAVAPFNIARGARTVDIELETESLVKPGTDLTINYSTSKPAKIVVYAVNEGILQVAKYAKPDPLAFFFQKRALEVNTSQMVDLILPDFESYQRFAAPGGGEARSLAGKNLNPFRRKGTEPVAYWSGIVDAGPDVRSLTYSVPDHFNGELRLFAVAVAESAVGSTSSRATVRAPFVITPNVLTAAAPGDEFDVTVGLANTLEGSGTDVAITLAATPSENLQIIGDDKQLLKVDEGREVQARFRIRALDKPGAADLRFVAEGENQQSTLGATLSVRPAVAYVTAVKAAVSEQTSSRPLKLEFDRRLYDELASKTDGLLSYLDVYPHACAEQIVSKVFPQIGFLGSQDYSIDEAEIRTAFDAVVRRLRERQQADGGFRFWLTSREAAEFPSVYIMHFLTDAKLANLPVPRAMLDSGLRYLEDVASNQTSTLEDSRLRAYATYVLTRNGVITTNHLTNLHEFLDTSFTTEWPSDLTATYMAASYALLKQQNLSNRLLGQYKMGAGAQFSSDFDTRLGRDAQYLYLLASHFPESLSSIDSQTITQMVDPILRNRFNTLSSAYTVLALSAYAKHAFADGDAKVTLSAANGDTPQALTAATLYARAQIKNSVDQVLVSGAPDKAIYHVLTTTGFDKTPPDTALAEGLEISRAYLDAAGNEVTKATIGEQLTVRLRVRSTGALRSNVALIDMLPGGFEVVVDSVRDSYADWYGEAKDVREDRVVVYGSFSDRLTEISYKVTATSSGSFVAPAAFATSMYNRAIAARTEPGRFDVRALENTK